MYQRAPIETGIPSPYIPPLLPSQQFAGNFGGTNSQLNAWSAANRAIYFPISLPVDVAVSSLRCWCGTGTANIDAGLYAMDGTRLASQGGTAMTASALNTLTLSSTVGLQAGLVYYVAMSTSSTDQVLTVGLTLGASRAMGILQQASAYPLPSTATFAQIASASALPLIALNLA